MCLTVMKRGGFAELIYYFECKQSRDWYNYGVVYNVPAILTYQGNYSRAEPISNNLLVFNYICTHKERTSGNRL